MYQDPIASLKPLGLVSNIGLCWEETLLRNGHLGLVNIKSYQADKSEFEISKVLIKEDQNSQ